jgi:thiol-disulfide isomerase/thioredoxin
MKIIAAITITILILSCNDEQPNKLEKESLDKVQEMPNFEFMRMDRKKAKMHDYIQQGKYTIIYYFSTDCDHCREQTAMYISNPVIKEKVKLFWLSNADMDSIRDYNERYQLGLDTIHNTIGKDINFTFTDYLNQGAFPLSILYDDKKKLRMIFSGVVDSATINPYIK